MADLPRNPGGHNFPAINASGNVHLLLGDVYQSIQVVKLTKEQKCHQLFKTSSYETFKDRNPPRVEGTCRWVLGRDQFRDWRSSAHQALLWISADPGCGKSVLSKSLVDHDLHNGGDQTTICYFFFKDNEEQDNLATALCALLHQLFDQQPSLLRYALLSYEKNGDKLRQESQEMWRIFRQCVEDRDTPPVLCVLDALDECRDEDRRQLIDMLCEVQQGATDASESSLKVLVTSRPYDKVQRWFEHTTRRWPCIRLRGEDKNDQIHQEINLVIDQRMQELADEFSLSEADRERLRGQLLHMQHRTYLWLHLAMEEVREMCRDSIYADEMQIESLPSSVNDAYERILSKIKDKQRVLARQVLLIIVGARRPLSLDEMAQAIDAAKVHERQSVRLGRVDVTRLEKQIREQCGLFVFVNHSQLFLIHQTAKEFLVAQGFDMPAATNLWKSCFNKSIIERTMANLCITYLTLTQPGQKASSHEEHSTTDSLFELQRTEDEHGFFGYCAEHWTSHLQDINVKEDENIISSIISLCATGTDLFYAWFSTMWKTVEPFVAVPKVQIQHVLSMSNLVFPLEAIFQRSGFDLEAQDSTARTALHWAAERGHDAVVGWLIEKGADVNAQGGEYRSALQAASRGGHEKIVQILVDAGADVNAQGGYYGSALVAASSRGHEKTVQILVDAGADVNARGGEYDSALQAASEYGHEKTVQILVDAGADVNAQGGEYRSALQAASRGGHEKTVQILVDAGADVNTQGGHYGSALLAASADGHEKTVQILVDAGADVNARGGRYDSALQAASEYGHEKTVQILVDAGADVNIREKYDSALQVASRGGPEKIVQILVDAGADVNAQGGYYGSALLAASADGHEKTVQILVDAGADVNAQGGHYGSALLAALERGHEKIVQILVDAGADVNAQGGEYGSALQRASAGGHEKIVQILVDAGVNVNAEGGYYGSALQVASADGHEKIVQILVDAGADVNARGGRYGSALQAASHYGHEKVVQILMDAGADVNAQGGR